MLRQSAGGQLHLRPESLSAKLTPSLLLKILCFIHGLLLSGPYRVRLAGNCVGDITAKAAVLLLV